MKFRIRLKFTKFHLLAVAFLPEEKIIETRVRKEVKKKRESKKKKPFPSS